MRGEYRIAFEDLNSAHACPIRIRRKARGATNSDQAAHIGILWSRAKTTVKQTWLWVVAVGCLALLDFYLAQQRIVID